MLNKEIHIPFVHFPNRARKTVLVLFIVGIFYVLLIKVGFYALDFLSIDDAILRFINLGEIFIFFAVLSALLYLLLERKIKKRGKNAVVRSFQVFLVFSAIPYLLFAYRNDLWVGEITVGGMWGKVVFLFVIILPEIIAFLGFLFLGKEMRIPGSIVMVIAVFAAIQILPARRAFLFDTFVEGLFSTSKTKPFGKIDREFEFKRSLKAIENLGEYSKESTGDGLQTITIYFPVVGDLQSILQSEQSYKGIASTFAKKVLMVDVDLDSDSDGLSNFREAELLSDAHNKDTDGDGINDKKDSDPLNPYIKSDFGEIKAAVLGFYVDSLPFYLIENNFCNGKGEFGNFEKHVIILNEKQLRLWDYIFGKQHVSKYSPIYSGPGGSDFPPIAFLDYSFYLFRKISIVLVRYNQGIDSDGLIYLLVKWRGRWKVVGGRMLWT